MTERRFFILRLAAKILKNIKITIQIIIGFFICLPYTLDFKTDYLLSVFSTGDTLIMGGFVSTYKKNHPDRSVRVIVKKSHEQIVEFNKERIGKPIYISTRMSLLIRPYFIVASKITNRFRFCMHDKTLFHLDLDAAARITCFGLWPCYKRIFSLSAQTQFMPPNYPKLSDADYVKLAEQFGLDVSKIVILAPYTITMQEYDYTSLFTELASKLAEQGFAVYTNTTDERVIEGTKVLYTDFNQIVSLAQNEKLWVISVRSGLCDLLRFANCHLTVLYPSQFWKDMFSIKKMFGTRTQLEEKIISPKTGKAADILEETYENIVDQ